jgi:hypothetical protein
MGLPVLTRKCGAAAKRPAPSGAAPARHRWCRHRVGAGLDLNPAPAAWRVRGPVFLTIAQVTDIQVLIVSRE